MVFQEFLSIWGALETTKQVLFWSYSKRQLQNMAYHQELEVTRVEKTLKYHSLCFPIHKEAQEGVAWLPGKVYITNGLRDFGGISTIKLHSYITIFSITFFRSRQWCAHVLFTLCVHPSYKQRFGWLCGCMEQAWSYISWKSTPLQLWMMGMNSVVYSDLVVAQEVFDEVSFRAWFVLDLFIRQVHVRISSRQLKFCQCCTVYSATNLFVFLREFTNNCF